VHITLSFASKSTYKIPLVFMLVNACGASFLDHPVFHERKNGMHYIDIIAIASAKIISKYQTNFGKISVDALNSC